jgi:hypothetical protein
VARNGLKDTGLTPVSPRYYSPGLPILLERGYGLRVEIFESDGEQIAPHHIPTFEETFETREEAIEFGFAEGKKLIDSGQLSRLTN